MSLGVSAERFIIFFRLADVRVWKFFLGLGFRVSGLRLRDVYP